jgi:hypothetical protein
MTADPPPQVRSIRPQRRVRRDQPPPAVNGGLPNHLATQVRTSALVVWSHCPGTLRPSRSSTQRPDGWIVSLHFGHPGTVAALPGILDDLQSRGLQAVSASTLLAG